MKKNVLKIVILILIILLLLIVINIYRNYSILKKISKSNEELKNSLNNYYFKQVSNLNSEFPYGNYSISSFTDELFVKDNSLKHILYLNNKVQVIEWFDDNTKENISINEQDKTISTNSQNEKELNLVYKEQPNQIFITKDLVSKLLLSNIFTPFAVKDGCYVIKDSDWTYYINKDTCLIEKGIGNSYTFTYTLEKNVVTNDDIQKPDLSQYSDYKSI